MPLWNEIEGQTLEGLTLRKLLRSEGRTAWFSTEDPAGAPGVLSVFEALNDEDAVEARLQAAARVAQPNLLAIRKIGRGSLEDESLIYALMEPFDQTRSDRGCQPLSRTCGCLRCIGRGRQHQAAQRLPDATADGKRRARARCAGL